MWIGYIFEQNYGSGGLHKKVCKRKSVALCPVSYITGMLHHLFSAFTLFLDFSTISHETSEHNLLVNTTWDCWQQQQKSHEQQESLISDQKTKQLTEVGRCPAYSAITWRTLLAKSFGSSISSWLGLYTGRNWTCTKITSVYKCVDSIQTNPVIALHIFWTGVPSIVQGSRSDSCKPVG